MGLARTLKHAVEEMMHGARMAPSHPALPRPVRHGAAMRNRGQMDSCGRAPCELRKGRPRQRPLPGFCEKAFYLPVGQRESRQADKWLEGVFCGIRDDNDEARAATPKGLG